MNNYNPQIHHRRSIRLKEYDYSLAGAYFITICCEDMICRFGHIENKIMILNEYGAIANNEWIKLCERFSNLELDAFQIMPNHMHGIIILNPPAVRAALAAAPNVAIDIADTNTTDITIDKKAEASPAPTVGDIVGAYKSLVFNGCLDLYKMKNEKMGKLWQRNYYEHIIRNEQSYQNISNYIINNPSKWEEDKFFKL